MKTPNRQPESAQTAFRKNDPDGIRTRVTGVKGQCPRPLDDGAAADKRGKGCIVPARPLRQVLARPRNTERIIAPAVQRDNKGSAKMPQ